MSRSVLLLLTVILLKNEVKCGTLGKISRSGGSLMPRAREALPSNATQLNLGLPSSNEVLANASIGTDRPENATSSRKGKFFSKFAVLAGLNIGGSASAVPPSLASLAKISESAPNVQTRGINPYFAALYDPYPYGPSPYNVQQSIVSLYRLLDRIQLQLDRDNATANSSIPQIPTPQSTVIPENTETEIIDARKRRKDKLKMSKKAAEKRRKQEKERLELEYELEEDFYDDDEKEEVTRAPQRTRVPAKKKMLVAKQAAPMLSTAAPTTTSTAEAAAATTTTTTTTTKKPEIATETPVANMTDNGNGTSPGNPGYYGGNPQQIGNVGLTYDTSQNAYGPPAYIYGPPSNKYGSPANNFLAPSNSYGTPFNSYGTPSNSYGTPSNSYGTPSNSYGTPSNSYGTPSNTYGTPSNSYATSFSSYGAPPLVNGPSPFANGPAPFANGPSTFAIGPFSFSNGQAPFVTGAPQYPNGPSPSLSYGSPQYPAAQDQEPVYFEDPTGNSFITPERWSQFPPFARSLKLDSSTRSPPVVNRNGFVPI